MPRLLMLALLAAVAAPESAPHGAIVATIRGTAEPVEVQLLLRDDAEDWKEVAHKSVPATTRRVRFDGLASGVYQLLVRGSLSGQQLGTKVGVGTGDTRRPTINIEPFVITGSITFGGTELGAGTILLRHRELHWRAPIPVDADGTFRATLWQGGTFDYNVGSPALPTEFTSSADFDPAALTALKIDIPDGRIRGIVRDASSGAPVGGAIVALQTNLAQREEHVKLTTGADGRFDFAGIKYGRHTVRIYPTQHLEPEPAVFSLGADARLRELEVHVDAGRPLPVVVIDRNDDPVANAQVFVVADAKLRARTTTDDDGRATVALPAGETATLFVVPAEGPFGMLRVPREPQSGRVPLYLPRTLSSLMIRAVTTTGAAMPPVSLLMRYNGELMPPEVAEALGAIQGLQLMTGADSEAHLQNIPSGSYEFWPYRTDDEANSLMASAAVLPAPIQVNVRTGENKIAVKFGVRTR
ncbi:MAG: hypothetical protein QOH21_888 [Acidobacteriota bacterium]|jgi:hypothetical protein|nr:hypothetical protein [Acidobacteriota bacterium]